MKFSRNFSGFFRPGSSNFSSIQTLLGDFLNDRNSPSLIQENHSVLGEELIKSSWGNQPLERVVQNNDDLKDILKNPEVYKNAVCIIEPADHVGTNLTGENIRASSNIAFLLQYIADCDSILIPIWKTGKLDNSLLMNLLSNSLAFFIEGGHPTVKDPKSFSGLNFSLDDLQNLSEKIILSIELKTAPAIFICLGHQLVAQAHIKAIKRATQEVLETLKIKSLKQIPQYKNLLKVVKNIISVGQNLSVYKDNIEVAKGWDDPLFAVAINEVPEVGKVELHHYSHSGKHPSKDFAKLLMYHDYTSERDIGIVEQSVTFEKDLNIVMFHSDEVNEEAILFANWAYGELQKAIFPVRKEISVSELSWLLNLPTSIEIVCSTIAEGKLCTEVAATCINYMDYETRDVRRSFSFQFHPELLDDLREFNMSKLPTYDKLKNDDGIRMLIRVIYESITD